MIRTTKILFRFNHSTWSLASLNKLQDISSLTQHQNAVREEAIHFSYNYIKPYANQWDQKGLFPIQALKKTVGLGYTSLFLNGASKRFSTLQGSLVFQGLSHSSVPFASFLSVHNLCVSILEKYLNQTLKQKYLKKIINLEKIVSFCLTQPESGSDSRNLKTTAVKDGSNYILNGKKAFVTNAQYADMYIVVAKTNEKDVSMILVQKQFPGIQISQSESKMGWKTNSTNQITFNNCIIPESNIIGKQGQGFKIAMQGLDIGRINIASCSIGAAAAALAKSINYVKNREQFGKKLHDFQSISFKLADMNTQLQSSRLLLRNSARMLDNNNSEKSVNVAMAKKYVTQSSTNIVDKAIQIHGGYGYLSKYELQRYYRDVRVHEIIQGTNQIMQLIISRRWLKQ